MIQNLCGLEANFLLLTLSRQKPFTASLGTFDLNKIFEENN